MNDNSAQPQNYLTPNVGNVAKPTPVVAEPNKQVPIQSPKKSKSKKILLLILGLLLIVIFGVGMISLLGGKPVANETSLVWWGFWDDPDVIEPILKEYKDKTGIVVKYVYQDRGDYRERLTSSMAKGTAPDIFRIHNTWVPMFARDLSVIPENVMSQEEYESTFYPISTASFTTDRGIVAIPLQYDGLGLFVNIDLLTTFGKTLPDSWDELRALAKDLTVLSDKDNLEQAGLALGLTGNVDNWEEILGLLLIQSGANLSQPSNGGALEALQYYNLFFYKDKVWDQNFPSSTLAFATGKLAMMFGPSYRAYEIRDKNPRLKFKVIPVPQLPKFNDTTVDTGYATFWGEAVWAKSSKSAQAWDFLKFMSTQETLQKLQENEKGSRTVYPEPYPRRDMRNLQLNDTYVGGIVKLAPVARTWYLASKINDGDNGINTRLSTIFKGVLASPDISEKTILTPALNVRGVLSTYGLASAPPPPEE